MNALDILGLAILLGPFAALPFVAMYMESRPLRRDKRTNPDQFVLRWCIAIGAVFLFLVLTNQLPGASS